MLDPRRTPRARDSRPGAEQLTPLNDRRRLRRCRVAGASASERGGARCLDLARGPAETTSAPDTVPRSCVHASSSHAEAGGVRRTAVCADR